MSVMKILAVTLLVCAMVVLNEAEPQTHLFKREYGCPSGWYPNDQLCYLFDHTARTWHDAERHCRLLGGHLASVHSQHVSHTFLPWLLKTYGKNKSAAWLGGYNPVEIGNWNWADKSPFEPNTLGFTSTSRWEDCLRMSLTSRNTPVWDALKCSHALPSVCARRL